MADSINASDFYKTQMAQASAQRSSSMKEQTLGLQDFLKLMVAQLQNQDMMNPTSDTEFIAQLAQFSSLQAMTSMADQYNNAYAVSMIGKEVTAATLDKDGNLQQTTGVVTGVGLFEGTPVVYIGKDRFELSNIMVVGKLPTAEEPEGGEGEGGGETVDPDKETDPDKEV